MRRSEIESWIAEHGGQKHYQEKWIDVPNPNYDPSTARATGETPKSRQKHVLWTASDGQVLEVIDDSQDNQGGIRPGDNVQDSGTGTWRDPDYTVVGQGDPDNTDSRSPEKKAQDEEDARESRWNQLNGPGMPGTDPQSTGRGSGRYETHDARAQREAREQTQSRLEADDAARRKKEQLDAENRARELGISEQQATEQAQHNRISEETAGRQAGVAERGITLQEEEAARAAKTPKIVGTPTDTTRKIVSINPQTGAIESVDNPAFDAIKADSERKREELRLAIEQNKMTAEVAAAEYKRWYDANVAAPLALAAERRAQAEEKRQALQAEEQRKQFAASNAVARAGIGEQAATRATQAEESLLPYRVGGTFAGNFASAINGLAAGGRLDSNAASGVHFQGSDFTFSRPDFKKIAQNATREALKHLTPYNPSDQSFQVGDYTGLNMPTSDTLGTAPAAPTMIDTASQINNLTNMPPYQAPTN